MIGVTGNNRLSSWGELIPVEFQVGVPAVVLLRAAVATCDRLPGLGLLAGDIPS